MKNFDQLQEEKIERAERLFKILGQLAHLEMKGNMEFIEKFISTLPDHLEYISKRIQEQLQLCDKDNQCMGLLTDELESVGKAIDHARLVRDKVVKDLDVPMIVSVLKGKILPRNKQFFKRMRAA